MPDIAKVSKSTPKLTDGEKLKVKALALKLDGRGWTQTQIRDSIKRHLGIEISQPMVGIYLKQAWAEAKKDWDERSRDAVEEKVAQLREVRREAWKAWFRSMQDADKHVEEYATTKEQVAPDDFVTSEDLLKRIETKEGRLANNAYLQTIRGTLKDERELLGLDPVAPQASTNVNVVVAGAEFWSGLAKQVAAQAPMAVERRLVEAVTPRDEYVDGHDDVGDL